VSTSVAREVVKSGVATHDAFPSTLPPTPGLAGHASPPSGQTGLSSLALPLSGSVIEPTRGLPETETTAHQTSTSSSTQVSGTSDPQTSSHVQPDPLALPLSGGVISPTQGPSEIEKTARRASASRSAIQTLDAHRVLDLCRSYLAAAQHIPNPAVDPQVEQVRAEAERAGNGTLAVSAVGDIVGPLNQYLRAIKGRIDPSSATQPSSFSLKTLMVDAAPGRQTLDARRVLELCESYIAGTRHIKNPEFDPKVVGVMSMAREAGEGVLLASIVGNVVAKVGRFLQELRAHPSPSAPSHSTAVMSPPQATNKPLLTGWMPPATSSSPPSGAMLPPRSQTSVRTPQALNASLTPAASPPQDTGMPPSAFSKSASSSPTISTNRPSLSISTFANPIPAPAAAIISHHYPVPQAGPSTQASYGSSLPSSSAVPLPSSSAPVPVTATAGSKTGKKKKAKKSKSGFGGLDFMTADLEWYNAQKKASMSPAAPAPPTATQSVPATTSASAIDSRSTPQVVESSAAASSTLPSDIPLAQPAVVPPWSPTAAESTSSKTDSACPTYESLVARYHIPCPEQVTRWMTRVEERVSTVIQSKGYRLDTPVVKCAILLWFCQVIQVRGGSFSFRLYGADDVIPIGERVEAGDGHCGWRIQ
jgi:hypothetical protein